MIFPDEEEVSILAKDSIHFGANIGDLIHNLSPHLPLHFDKSYLPNNICQRQYLRLSKCLITFDSSSDKSCSYQLTAFQNCRILRDARILQGIKTWEQKHLLSLDKQNRTLYLQGLTFKLHRLQDQYDRVPSTISKAIKMAQLESQIQKIKWRMKYINKIVNE